MDNSCKSSVPKASKVVDCEQCGSEFIVRSKRDNAAHFHDGDCLHRQEISSEANIFSRSLPLDNDWTEKKATRFQGCSLEKKDSKVQASTKFEKDFSVVGVGNLPQRKEANADSDHEVIIYEDPEKGHMRLTKNGFTKSAQKQRRALGDPLTPEYRDRKKRISSYRSKTIILYRRNDQLMPESCGSDSVNEALADKHAENGFYLDSRGSVICFHCGLTFRVENLEDPFWDVEVEHARWSPCCSHWLSVKGEDFIHYLRTQGKMEVIL